MFSDLLGKVLTDVKVEPDTITFTTQDGEKFTQYHESDCCESVTVEDVAGDTNDLIGSPITMAEESSNRDHLNKKDVNAESFTWTFYKLATVKGYVTIRWFGSSNGYYSESVSFRKDS